MVLHAHSRQSGTVNITLFINKKGREENIFAAFYFGGRRSLERDEIDIGKVAVEVYDTRRYA